MKKALALIACSATLLLAGCGGGDTTAASLPDTAEGLWNGDLSINNGATLYSFDALVTPDGALWMVYTNSSGGFAGALQGNGSSDQQHHSYAAASIIDRNSGTAYTGSLTGAYTAQSKFNAVTLTSDGSTSRSLQINPANSADYNLLYGQGLLLPTTATSFSGAAMTANGSTTLNLIVQGHNLSGQVDPAGTPCTYTGTASSPDANSYFRVTLDFPAVTACSSLGLSGSMSGVIFLDSSSSNRTVLMLEDAALAAIIEPVTTP